MQGIVAFDVHQLAGLVQIALAMILGGVLGLERERAHKPAGLRTHMLVSGSAALLVILGDVILRYYDTPQFTPGVRADPLRIVSAVITGVSFLGAGTIIRRTTEQHDIEGLTTAASLLMAAAIGASIALTQTALAVGTTVLVLVILRFLRRVETSLRGD